MKLRLVFSFAVLDASESKKTFPMRVQTGPETLVENDVFEIVCDADKFEDCAPEIIKSKVLDSVVSLMTEKQKKEIPDELDTDVLR